MAERVFSGMRPTGRLHLGHLAGALRNWVALQESYDCFYCIVDWHALMSEYKDSSRIRENSLQVLIDWLSVGLDPKRCTIFVQSHVPQHTELHVALSVVTPLGWLTRNPTFKDQLKQLKEKDVHTYAFLGYPVLQAADILLYKAELVPVGEDQAAHLEICREIARRFNFYFGPVFPEPRTLLTETPRVPGTDGRKMSKSYGNAIELGEDPGSVWEKLRTMVTDPARYRRSDPGNPDVCPVFDLHKVFTSDLSRREELAHGCRSASIGCIDCKRVLFDHLEPTMAPIRERRRYLESHGEELLDIAREGARKAREVAEPVMEEVKRAIGLP